MKLHLQKIAARAAKLLPDTLMLAGAGGIAHGAWLVYVPAGYIVAGTFLLAAGVLAARKAA